MMDWNFKTVNIRGEKKVLQEAEQKKWGMEKNGEKVVKIGKQDKRHFFSFFINFFL